MAAQRLSFAKLFGLAVVDETTGVARVSSRVNGRIYAADALTA